MGEPGGFALHPPVPHEELSVAMRITSLRTAAAVDVRPGRRLADVASLLTWQSSTPSAA